MPHANDRSLLEPVPPVRVDLPHLSGWMVPRRRLADLLDLGITGLVTSVIAPTGWGKTLGVANWAASSSAVDGVIWLSGTSATADADQFWELAEQGLAEAGVRDLAPVPPISSTPSYRMQALTQLGKALRHSGRWLLVLDDYPSGEVGDLGHELEMVMDHAGRGLSLLVISHGEPALAVQRHRVAGDLTRVTAADLAMDRHEVASVLDRHGVDAGELTARYLERHTGGWACGVRLCAAALRDGATIEEALEEADRGSADLLAAEVLGKCSTRIRDLIVRTSVVEEVAPDLARAVLGPHIEDEDVLAIEDAGAGFIEVLTSGSFRCHPLLRAAASRELAREPLAVRRAAVQRTVQWHLDHGYAVAGLEIAMQAQDWLSAGRALVQSYAVPWILAGSVTEPAETALAVPAVAAGEPLIDAALLLRRDGPDARAAVRAMLAERPVPEETAADELSAVFLRLVLARARGDVTAGFPLAARARELMPRLGIEEQRELFAILEAQVGALELCRGELERAEIALRHGAVGACGDAEASPAPRDCLGQLALLEAFQGNLRQAGRHAGAVLKGAGSTPGAGIAHAHLATALVHLERVELAPARQHLDRAAEGRGDEAEPWYGTARLLTEARWLVAIEQPEDALRLLAPALDSNRRLGQPPAWTSDLLVLSGANALMAVGEPRLALDLLSTGVGTSPVETGLLRARARLELGDVPGARTTLAGVAKDALVAPLATQIECGLLGARLAGDSARRHVLVDRALRQATRETVRRPVAQEATWVLPLVNGDPELRRSHGGFLAGLKSPTHALWSRRPQPGPAAPQLIETLTVREAQVLGLLAEMCSTEEIASELYLSVNTVKTYVRGILRKLTVNRRVDAVRRGRELGLC